jgi:hypothetical protein
MNSRERFRETMSYGAPDRVPYFEEGIRRQVLKAWRKQGLSRKANLSEMFPSDERKEIEPDLEPRPKLRRWPTSIKDLDAMRRALDPHDPGRLPWRWQKRVRAWQTRDYVLMLRVHRGFFLSMGVNGWRRFREVIDLLNYSPEVVRQAMKIQGEFAASLAERVLGEVEVDAALFVEPISEIHGPLISPKMYEQFVLSSYEPLLDVLNRYGVESLFRGDGLP